MDYGPSFDLRTVSSSVVQDLTNFSRLKFLGVSDPIDNCAGRTVVEATVCRMLPLVAPADFSEKLIFGLFWVLGVTILILLIYYILTLVLSTLVHVVCCLSPIKFYN